MKKKLLFLLLLATPIYAQSPCNGKIQDKLNHPMIMGEIPKPAAGQSFVDPQFGTKITRISNALPSEGTNAVINALYNSMRGWNADMSQIIAWHRGGAKTYEFYQGDQPYAHIGQIVFGSTTTLQTAPADIEHIIWDSDDPNVFYYPAYDSNNSRLHPMLMKVVLHPVIQNGIATSWASPPTITIVRDFQPECAAHGVPPGANGYMNVLSLGHGQDMSYDGKRSIGLRCGNPNVPNANWAFIYSVTNNTIISAYSAIDNYDSPPWPCPSGNCFWRQRPGYIYDANFNKTGVTTMANTLEHSVVGRTLMGSFDYVVQGAYDELPSSGSMLFWNLTQTNAKPTTIIGQGTGWPYPPSGSHPSLPAKDGSGWGAVGIVGTGTGVTVLDNEILLGNVNTLQVCRIAHARTCDGKCGTTNWNYWAETHPQISNDGYRVLFDSDWEGSNTVDLYVADLRPSAISILTPSLPNAVKGEPYHVPISIAGGNPPYTCSFIGVPPAGIHPNGCAVDGPSTSIETQTFTFHACDSLAACTDHSYPLTSQERPIITSASPLPDAIIGMPFISPPLTAIGGVPPYIWTLVSGAFCAGTKLNPDGSWTIDSPITLQTCLFTVKATDSNTQLIAGQKDFSQTIKMPPPITCSVTIPTPTGTVQISIKP